LERRRSYDVILGLPGDTATRDINEGVGGTTRMKWNVLAPTVGHNLHCVAFSCATTSA